MTGEWYQLLILVNILSKVAELRVGPVTIYLSGQLYNNHSTSSGVGTSGSWLKSPSKIQPVYGCSLEMVLQRSNIRPFGLREGGRQRLQECVKLLLA